MLTLILNYGMSEKIFNINMLSKENHHPNVCIKLGVKHSSPIALHFNSI